MSEDYPIGSIFLIDDNTIDQKLYKRIIDRSGMVGAFTGFLSAEEALEHLRRSDHPAADAILLDINMPRMDGFEFLEAATAELGDQFAKMVVMMLTTSIDPRDEERARQYSVVKDYCNKPLTLEYLKTLAEILKKEKAAA